ncbi:MAG: VWA domain-containing protein [Verrucomicrobiota bacterium]|nr:VWA domain-containing protein [Verrucomicrobiota bacterium]
MKTIFIAITMAALALCLTTGKSEEIITVKLTPDRNKIVKTKDAEVLIKLELKGREASRKRRTPVNLALVLDRSGSMAGPKLEKAKQAACVAIDQLSEKDTISVVIYDDLSNLLIPPQKVKDKSHLKSLVREITDGGSTALYAGVEMGAQQVNKFFAKENVNRVFLLSDGIANVGPSSPAELARLGRNLREQGIQVTTIGLGDDYNEDLMVSLAEASAANYYYVQDTEKLPGIFAEELGKIQNILARNLRVIIVLPEGVEGIEVVGEPDIRFTNRRAEIILPEVYGSQNRSFLVRARVVNASGGKMDVAQANIDYKDEESGKDKKQQILASIEMTENQKESDASLNVEVAQEAALVQNRVVREEALKLADSGKKAEAVLKLKEQSQAISNLPAAARTPKLDQERDSLSAVADEVEAKDGFDKRSRKAFQYENYKQKNQKE